MTEDNSCQRCGRPRPADLKTYCRDCQDAINENNRNYYLRTGNKPNQKQQQTRIAKMLQRRGAAIWGWVRENRHSLDSERGRKFVAQELQNAINDVEAVLHDMIDQRDSWKKQATELRKLKRMLPKDALDIVMGDTSQVDQAEVEAAFAKMRKYREALDS